MYTAHFGLKEPPFAIAPDPRYLYMSPQHRDALAHLVYGIGQGGGFVQLTGEVGTGKTTVCRCLLQQLPPHVDVALVLNPRLTSLELLATVCDELRIPYSSPTDSVKVLVDALYRYLLDAHARGRRTVLVIDEAQNLSVEVLEQIRLLTNLETDRDKLLQVILIGQPELAALLARPALRQLAQRVTARYHLQPLPERDTAACVRHRLRVAGQSAMLFTPAALREVHRRSGGVPRLINLICDRALLGAYAHDRYRVDAQTVRRAASEALEPADTPWRRWLLAGLRWPALAGTAAVLVLAAAGVLLLPARVPEAPPVASTGAAVADPQGPVSPTDTSAAAGGPGGETAGPARLASLLENPTLAGDKATAFSVLFSRWGVAYDPRAGALGCARAEREGLSCLHRRGSWSKLRRFDVPALVELARPGGEPRQAAVVALDDESVTLAFGPREVRLPLLEVDALWDGSFVLLWRPPDVGALPITPGARGRGVAWVSRRLDELEGAPAGTAPPVYDERMRARVAGFQQSRALNVDGVAGVETVAHLALAVRQPDVPRLASARP
jgi:general secretion pathway protein A